MVGSLHSDQAKTLALRGANNHRTGPDPMNLIRVSTNNVGVILQGHSLLDTMGHVWPNSSTGRDPDMGNMGLLDIKLGTYGG